MRLLIVEDEADLADALRVGLRAAGYAVDVADSLAAASERLTVHAYDLMLLDIGLPDGDGFELCRALRNGQVPGPNAPDDPHSVGLRVLIVTARGSLDDRVRGLDDGADDYIVKPFAFPELLARIRALLRRDPAAAGAVLTVGSLTLDTARHVASRGDRPLDLTRKEFGVLEYLMTRPNHVVSTEELLEHVWDEHTDPFTNTVRVTVGTLRRKLARDDEPAVIETVVSRGYRLKESS